MERCPPPPPLLQLYPRVPRTEGVSENPRGNCSDFLWLFWFCFCCCDKHQHQKQLEKAKVYLTYTSGSQSIPKGSPGRNPGQEPEVETMEGCRSNKNIGSFTASCSAGILVQSRLARLGMVSPTVGWPLGFKTSVWALCQRHGYRTT